MAKDLYDTAYCPVVRMAKTVARDYCRFESGRSHFWWYCKTRKESNNDSKTDW